MSSHPHHHVSTSSSTRPHSSRILRHDVRPHLHPQLVHGRVGRVGGCCSATGVENKLVDEGAGDATKEGADPKHPVLGESERIK
jgi:hypothetical protein